MNYGLRKEIIRHVMAHFGVIPSTFVDHQKSDSLISPTYLLGEKVFFEVEGENYHGKVWGCQLSVSQTEVKVLLVDCSIDENIMEFAMVVQSKGAPIYGLYIVDEEISSKYCQQESDLSVSLDGKEWMTCTTFLQATFLAAMEQVRDLKLSWFKCTEYTELYKALLSFLNHHDTRE